MTKQPAVAHAFSVIRGDEHQHRQLGFRHRSADGRRQLFIVQTHGIVVLVLLLLNVITQTRRREFRKPLRDISLIRDMRCTAVQHHQERFVPVQRGFLDRWREYDVCAYIRSRANLRIFPQINVVDTDPVAQSFQTLRRNKGGLITLFFRIRKDIGRLRLVRAVVIRLAQVIHQHRNGNTRRHGVRHHQASCPLILFQQGFQLWRGIALIAQRTDMMRVKAFANRQDDGVLACLRSLNRRHLVRFVMGHALVFARQGFRDQTNGAIAHG